ncbi:MAG: NAD(P)-dependent oxidoreductase, partial [Candidatus Binataceae bacterium]
MKIVSAFALQPRHRQLLENAAPGAELIDGQCSSPRQVLELAAGGCDVIMTFFVPDDLLKVAPKLQWIQLFSAGADHMSKGPLAGGAVTVTTTSGVHAASMAEFALTMMLMHAHRFNVTSRAQFHHKWINAIEFMSTADQLRGKTAGIIGYGSIGRATARLASA